MTETQREASEQVAAIAVVIRRLGGIASEAAISGETGLSIATVRHRLARSGPSMMRTASRFFSRSGDSWGLTDRGRELVNQML